MEFVLVDGVLRRAYQGENIETLEKYEINDTEEISFPEGTIELQINAGVKLNSEIFKCKNTRKVILPEGLEKIGDSSFHEWKNLETVIFPESIEEIDEFAFYRSGIKKMVIPESVEDIGDYAFADCVALEEFIFPSSMTETFPSILNGCKNLKSIKIPPYLTTMLELEECGFETFIVPEGIEEIPAGCFDHCEKLTYVEFPSTLKKEEIYAFEECDALERITFKKYLKSFTICLEELPSLKRIDVPLKDAAKAKRDFPDLMVGDLDGNIIYNFDDKVVEERKPREKKPVAKKQEDPMDDSKIRNRSFDIEHNGISFHVDIIGTGTITKTVNYYIKAASEDDGTKCYDPMELVRINYSNLFETETHTGVRIHTLGKDRSACQFPGSYSTPISPDQVITLANDFKTKALQCLKNENVEKILSKVPHKKNGTLHKKRVTCILKLNCVDEDAMICMIYAKNVDDTTLEIGTKQFYVGDDISQTCDLAHEILR